MATAQYKEKVTAGSAEWIGDERASTLDFVRQETEEFTFSVRNEMEWLNEHLAEVFNRRQFDVVEAFKTPGRLRGKTPRTARKIHALETRAPLTDVFSSNAQTALNPIQLSKYPKQNAQFTVAEDEDSHQTDQHIPSRVSTGLGKENTDSGYHGLTEDDESGMEVDDINLENQTATPLSKPVAKMQQDIEHRLSRQSLLPIQYATSTRVNVPHEKFLDKPQASAITTKQSNNPSLTERLTPLETSPLKTINSSSQDPRTSHPYSISDEIAAAFDAALDEAEAMSPKRPSQYIQQDSSPSDTSSMARPVIRKKSSLTFASLPAREPLTNKKSTGHRISRLSQVEQPKLTAGARDSHYGRLVGPKSQAEAQQDPVVLSQADTEDELNLDEEQGRSSTILEAARAHQELKDQSKASTQRLQERLAMLGKSNPPRLSRSIPTTITISQTIVHESATGIQSIPTRMNVPTDDDDWIGPMGNADQAMPSSTATPVHSSIVRAEESHKSKDELVRRSDADVSYPVMARLINTPEKPPARSIVGPSYPQLHLQMSTTPIIPPTQRKNVDGPLSASKAKLYSVLRSAKGMFASTAHATTQARTEMKTSDHLPANLNNSSTLTKHDTTENSRSQQGVQVNGSQNSVSTLTRDRVNKNQTCNTRRSSQRLENMKQVAGKCNHEQEGSEEKEHRLVDGGRQEAIPNNATDVAVSKLNDIRVNHISSHEHKHASEELPPPPVPPKTQPPISQLQKPGELRRLLRPTKDVSKARPAPVSIKLASQRIGQIAPSNASLGLALHESLAQPTTSRPALSKKQSTSSFHTTSSSQSFKSSMTSSSARPKALEAAARKKEQDEREAQRKLEQKRDLEKKRAARLDEERRLAEEERRLAEEQRTVEQLKQTEAKNNAQRQAAEQRKVEAMRRNEQARKEATALRSYAVNEPTDVLQADRSELQTSHTRDDINTTHTMPNQTSSQTFSLTAAAHVNPAKPAKRPLDRDGDTADNHDEQPHKYGQSDAVGPKRRRTSENHVMEAPSRPTMAPPIRPSTLHKKLSNKFAQGFLNNATSTHVAPSMLKTAVTAQHNLQHPKTPHMNDLAKFSNAKITFAEQPHPAHSGPSHAQAQPQHQQRTLPANKTPGTAHKSSPQYPNGDSIDLPEIATDSEDSGDENDFVPPDWANSPELRELLRNQQLVDPLQVFGPIAPLLMEDVFKGNKERQARYRARTSSANWTGQDRLTEDERRLDREARERLEREGAWTYGGSL